ncbi:MAG: glucose-6-phosphate isomerase [Cyclobacteriaceae bacterium]|nr:glucose-6-phosphate isomerase [Cyclobacteriaceae bacterium]
MQFNPGFDIKPIAKPMGFSYGNETFGPDVEIRTLDAIRKSLWDPECSGPEQVYAIAMDVGKIKHKEPLEQRHLLFGVVTYAAGTLGKEPVRSQGHIHKKSDYAQGWSTPEVYEIWSGEAIIYMQESANDYPGRCFAVHALPGEVVLVPPGWAHATISANASQPLTFGAWCDREYGFDYDDVRAHGGLAFFPFVKEGKIVWDKNKKYHGQELTIKSPRIYTEFGLEPGVPIYSQFESAMEKFQFVPRPDLYQNQWKQFVP